MSAAHDFAEEKITFHGIQIDDGWTIGDLETLTDCDEAFAVLTAAVASIEGQLELAGVAYQHDPVWTARAKAALRWKKAALQAVNTKRSQFSREAKAAQNRAFERAFVDAARDRLQGDEFNQIMHAAHRMAGAIDEEKT